jgi:hypothetical protein
MRSWREKGSKIQFLKRLKMFNLDDEEDIKSKLPITHEVTLSEFIIRLFNL